MLDYWLGRCEGFELASPNGGQMGVVERVLLDDDGRARALVVRTQILGRCRVIDPLLVESVVPEHEAITVRSVSTATRRPRPEGFLAPTLVRTRPALGTAAAWAAPRLHASVLWGLRALAAVLHAVTAAGVKAGSLAATGIRLAVRELRGRLPALAAGARRAVSEGAAWARPRIATLARSVAAGLVGMSVFLFAVGREIVLALRTYGTLLAREAARRRAAAQRRPI